MKFVLFLFLIVCSFASVAQKQGLSGQVFWVSGNQMPGPEVILSPNQGAVREILVYDLTTMNDVTVVGPFFRDIKTKFIVSIHSNSDGTFKVKLPPGSYSIFTKEKNGLYANLFDEQNNINPVVIKPSRYTWKTITIDYEAAY